MLSAQKKYDIIEVENLNTLQHGFGKQKGRFYEFYNTGYECWTAENRYEMKFLAGKNGWSNSISWVHLLEDTTIIQNFWGKGACSDNRAWLSGKRRLDASGTAAEPVSCIRACYQCGAVHL